MTAGALTHRLLLMAVACLLAILLTVSACGGDDDDEGTEDAATVTEDSSDEDEDEPTRDDEADEDAEPTPEDEDDGEDGESDGAVDACTLLTPDEIQSATGAVVGEGESSDIEPFYSCSWSSESFDVITTSVLTGGSDVELDAYYELTEDAEEVDGLGNRAQWSDDLIPLLEVQTDDYVFDISVSVSDLDDEQAKEAAIELADIVIDRLP